MWLPKLAIGVALLVALALAGCSRTVDYTKYHYIDHSRTPTAADLEAAKNFLVQHQNDPLTIPADTEPQDWQRAVVLGDRTERIEIFDGNSSVTRWIIVTVMLPDGTTVELHGRSWIGGTALDSPISNPGTFMAYYKPHAVDKDKGLSIYDFLEIQQHAVKIEGVPGTGMVSKKKF